MVVEFVISSEGAQRVDHAVRVQFPEVSRRVVQTWFAQGLVKLDGKVVKKGVVAVGGQVCRVEVEPETLQPKPAAVSHLTVLLDTPQVVVVDKAAGVPSAALAGAQHSCDSVATQLLALYPHMADVGYSPWDAGLIHRLDTNTSGVLVAAKTTEVFHRLTERLRQGAIDKTYLAWANAIPPHPRGRVTTPLRSDPRHNKRMIADRTQERGMKACETTYEVLATEGQYCLIRAKASVATRHQVRAHLAEVGCPLVGDTLYRGLALPGLARHALHAEWVSYPGDDVVEAFACSAPVPPELAQLTPNAVEGLRQHTVVAARAVTREH
jgi:23S rRNA pseudouridine1911/1915/1917 synthase